MYRIGEFSKICRVPVSALRYYSDLGLLPPVSIDPASGYRYYEVAQLPRLNRILALNDLGFFVPNMTQSRGFIALAALVVGKWNPIPFAIVCLLF